MKDIWFSIALLLVFIALVLLSGLKVPCLFYDSLLVECYL